MIQVLIDFINDIIDETSEEYELIFGKTKDEVKNVEQWYKYIFAGFGIFTGFIITLISSIIIDFWIGTIILFADLVSVLLILLKRQRRIRKLHEIYGEYISEVAHKKSVFLKLRKQIHYWSYLREDGFTSQNIRNSLIALETMDYAFVLYKIGIYEKLFPLLQGDTKSSVFLALMNNIKRSVHTIRELVNINKKPLPFFIHDEINQVYLDNKKYLPKYFMEPNSKSSYEVYINSTDYIEIYYGDVFKFIKKYGFKVFAAYNQKTKPYDLLLDEKLNIVKYRLKSKTSHR